MKKTIIAAAALVAMTACNKTLIEAPMTDSNYGYINLGITADTEMVVAKGISASYNTDLSNYNVALLVESGGAYVPFWTEADESGYREYSALSDSKFWTVPAGKYKIVVENKTQGESLDQNGYVRVEGTEEFTVNAGATQNVAVECIPVNSKVTVSKTDAFTAAFPTSSVSVTGDQRSFTLGWTAKPDETTSVKSSSSFNEAYFNGETQISWNLSVTLTDGTNKTYSNSQALETVAGTWSNIDFNASSTEGSINVTITVNDKFGTVEVITATINPGESGDNDQN